MIGFGNTLSFKSERLTTAAVSSLETKYLAGVSGAGAAVGGAAMVPGIGTGVAVGLSVAETVAFLDATALAALAVAQLQGHPVRDLPRRRALLLATVLGDDVVALVPKGPDGDTSGWGERLLSMPDADVERLNRRAERWLVTRFGPRQGMFIVGRLMPFGLGAAVGAAGNALTAKGAIARVRSAFPTAAPAPLSVVPPAATDDAATVTPVRAPRATKATATKKTAARKATATKAAATKATATKAPAKRTAAKKTTTPRGTSGA